MADEPPRIPAFADTVAELLDAADKGDVGGGVDIASMRLELPIEVQARRTSVGGMTLASGPTTQHFKTTFMPVLHQLRLTIRSQEGPDD